jgi:formate dehydrogenase iron-sulfur subunit
MSTATAKLYVPQDSAAVAVGANEVAIRLQNAILASGKNATLLRNSSRGLFWLEPLLEVQTAQGRLGFGPVAPEDVQSLLEAGLLDLENHPSALEKALTHPLCQGWVEKIPFLAKQERLTFARMGITQPLSLSDYEAHGGWVGLRQALALTPEAIVQQVTESGLRGRGGAAFPAGIKWKTVLGASATTGSARHAQKYIVCNADEGDSGTYSDRMTMEGDPFLLIEGMAIAGIAVGATKGYVYIRSEYPDAVQQFEQAIQLARAAGFLGQNLLGSGKVFELEVRMAAGAYVCGEETALLESLEGKRGIVRAKPPLPAIEGLWGQPTVINNVITLASVPIILAKGAEFYKNYGMGRSRGTLPFQLAGNIKNGGLVEKAFGLTLRELVFEFGGGTASGRPVKAVQVGGPLGAYVPESQWDTPLDYETYAAFGGVVGHGGVVVHDDRANLADLARYAMTFCALESCGKCTPCRIGSTRGEEILVRLQQTKSPQGKNQDVKLLRDLCDTMLNGSLCAMGGMTPYPVLSALNHYPEDFGLTA